MKRLTFYDASGGTVLSGKDWPTITAGKNDTPLKFLRENTGDEDLADVELSIGAIAGSEGYLFARLALDAATLSAPYGVDAAVSSPGAGGTWSGTGLIYYRITAINAIGETVGSTERSANITDTTETVTVTWTQITGATGYKIYRSTIQDIYTTPALRATVGITGIYVDSGAAVGAGALPSVNTTAGWNLSAVLSGAGAGGVWGATGTYYWRVSAYDATGVELASTLEASVDVDNTTKKVTLSWASAVTSGADSIKVYRSTSAGTYASPALVATLAGSATTYDDTGTATISGSLSSSPSYGLPPAFGSFTAAPLTIGDWPVGKQYTVWAQWVIPDNVTSESNPRLWDEQYVEA